MGVRTASVLELDREPVLPAPDLIPVRRPRARFRITALAAVLSGSAAVVIAVLGVVALSR